MFSYFILLLISSILFIIYLKKSAKSPYKNFPPGPPKLPIWGSYWFLLRENYNFLHIAFEKLAKRYKTNILGVYLGDHPAVVTFDYQLTKELLARDEFAGRPGSVLITARSHGDTKGIFFTDGPLWKSHRRFSLRHMRDYGFGRRSDVMENHLLDEIKYLINFLQTEPSTDELDICKQKGHVRVPDVFYGILINTVLLVVSSTHYDYNEARKYGKDCYKFVKSFDATCGAISITPWLRFIAPEFFNYSTFTRYSRRMEEFMKEQVEEHLKTFSIDHLRDFIDDFIAENMEQGTELDYHQLTLIAVDYMFPVPVGAGHTLAFFCALLVNYPDVQNKIQNEIDSVVGRSRLPSLNDRQNQPYLEATLREVFRFLSLTPLGLARRCLEDTTLGGYFIPKDTIMLPNLWTANKDPTVFPNPEQFKPERFLNPDGSLMKKDLTISFGAGKRLCAGETFARNTIFLIMCCLLHNFSIESTNGKKINMDDLEWGLTLSLKETWVKFVPRQ